MEGCKFDDGETYTGCGIIEQREVTVLWFGAVAAQVEMEKLKRQLECKICWTPVLSSVEVESEETF